MKCIKGNHQGKEKGFFLVEAAVALMIVSIVLYSAIPAWLLIQEKLEESHQKAVSLIAVQNEIERFNYYLEERGPREVMVDRFVYHVHWTVQLRGQVEEGRLSISWITASGKREEAYYLHFRPIKDMTEIKEESL